MEHGGQVKKYSLAVRIAHWVHTLAFLVQFVTGLIFYLPPLAAAAQQGWMHPLHRAGAIVFIAVPVLFLVLRPREAWRGLKWAFAWGRGDASWLKSAPRYYLLGNERGMPPQGKLNAGQKFWWLLTLTAGVLFIISGSMMEFGVQSLSPALLSTMRTVHDVCFVATGVMLILHIYLALFHPLMREALKSMIRGTVSVEYARAHHPRWLAEKENERND